MDSKFSFKLKRHIWMCDYEKLWSILTILMIISSCMILRGSTAPLLWDNAVTRFFLYSNPEGDKTLYNIAISYFAAYIFYIIQVYIPERNRTKKALVNTALDSYNFTYQVERFFFVWRQFTITDWPKGIIQSTNIRKIYYNEIGKTYVSTSDIENLKITVECAKEKYGKIIDQLRFQKCDDRIMQLFLDIDIGRAINRLYQVLLSAELMVQTNATIMETFDNKEIEDIELRIRRIQKLYGFIEFKGFKITEDEGLIKERNKMDLRNEEVKSENKDYFQNLPIEYGESLD